MCFEEKNIKAIRIKKGAKLAQKVREAYLEKQPHVVTVHLFSGTWKETT